MSEFTDYDNDEGLIEFANLKRKALPLSPSQSNFKVYCILVVEVGGEIILIHGTNGEQGYIGGAICAERAALLQMSHYRDPMIKKVIITTDSESPITPGTLCREYLLSHAPLDTPVVVGNGEGTKISHCTLEQLYPCQYLYRHLRRKHILSFAENFSATMDQVTDDLFPGVVKLYQRTKEAVEHDSEVAIHPLQLAAGVLYNDGHIEVSWMLKALEYGSTLDPVSQLVSRMENRRVHSIDRNENSGVDDPGDIKQSARVLLMIDQFGVCHAPHAQARSLMKEHNYGHVLCIVHSAAGKLSTHEASTLVPAPCGDAPLSHDEFLKIHED